ncbi:MAG TPA: CRTAC1 family protein, partial [Candidatus Polarisedimenticolia bacterium]|nr:CRTAC1 family protein [Candidatus Polarisedimenticolia bacterium]
MRTGREDLRLEVRGRAGLRMLACALVLCALGRCQQATEPAGPVPGGPGPQTPLPLPGPAPASPELQGSIPEILASLTRNLDPVSNVFYNSARVVFLKQAIEKAAIPRQQVMLTSNLADELLKSGQIEEAIRTAEPFLFPGAGAAVGAPPPRETHEFLATCYLRQGERDNCINRHNASSCLLPIRREAIHTVERGSRAAIRELLAVLEEAPDDLGARWLLNIAHMTIGRYPHEVPERWLIPPNVFTAEYEVGRFRNVAPQAGLVTPWLAGGGLMEDFDGDGLLDIMISSMGLKDQMRFFHSNGDGSFSDRTEAAGLLGEVGGLNMKHADFDNDGDQDVLVLRGGWAKAGGRFPHSLLRNDGSGRFDNVTRAAGVLNFHPTQTAAFGDYDNDGWLDLIVGNEHLEGDPNPSELYHNNGDGTFTDRTVNLGDPQLGYVKGVVWGDYDNDGLQDLYVSVQDGDNLLFHNGGRRDPPGPDGGDWRFTEVGRQAGVTEPQYSLPAWFWDYDNDGWLDIFVGGFQITDLADVAALHLGRDSRTATPRLYRNNRNGTFTDVSEETRIDRVALAMGSNYGDIDNDGYPDYYIGTGAPALNMLIPNRLFRNAGGVEFQDVTYSAGVGHLQKGHGIAFGDIDNDGDQDIFAEMGGFYEIDVSASALFENPGHGNRWITLKMEGRRSNRAAIGARIRVRVQAPAGPRDIYSTVDSGGSFGGNSLQQEIGLGDARSIEVVEVRWPTTGEVQEFRNVALDRAYHLIEGE